VAHTLTPLERVEVARVVLSTALDPFLSLTALASYSGLSVRTLRDYLALPPDQALPAYYLPGRARGGTSKILVRRSEFDEWIARYRSLGRPDVVQALRDLGLDGSDG